MGNFCGLCPKEHDKGFGRAWNQRKGKTLVDLDYAADLSVIDENVGRINKFLDILRVRWARIGLKVNVKKTMSLLLGVSEYEKSYAE